jgi:hypothetical protein
MAELSSTAASEGLRKDSPVLELLLADDGDGRARVLLPQLTGSRLEPLAARLFAALPPARRRALPGPAADAPPAAVRAWHRDAFLALPLAERDALVLAAGPGAASLAPVIEGSQVGACVREPLEAVALLARDGYPVPNRKALAALGDAGDHAPKPQLARFSNPQARSVLLAFAEADGLPVTLGPPPDADRWRELLFEQAMPLVRPVLPDGIEDAIQGLVTRLGYPPPGPGDAAETERTLRDDPAIQGDHADLLRRLSWLDAELYHRCRAPEQGA